MKIFIRFICLLICCLATAGYTQNAPVSRVGSMVSLDSTAVIPLYAFDFNNISSCSLKIIFDPAIASVNSVTIGPGLGGMISTNITTPGEVVIGWFTSAGVNLPDSSVIFYLNTTKAGNGSTTIHWVDDGYSCMYSDGSFVILNDSPTADYYFDGSLVFQSPEAPVTTLSDVAVTPNTSVEIPVKVANFQMIGSLSLNLQYDPSVMTFISFSNLAGFPGLMVNESQQGTLELTGLVPETSTPVSLNDNDTLLFLNFDYLDGFGSLSWIDDGPSCQYSGAMPVYPVLNDTPQSVYYINGSVSANALPVSAGAISGPSEVCSGTSGITYTVPVIAYATDYQWEVPEGIIIVSGQHSNAIVVDFNPDIFTGTISVYGTNSFGSGEPSSLEISSIGLPGVAGLITGQQEVCQGQEDVIFSVQPILGASSYNWMLPEGALIVGGATTNTITVVFSFSAISGAITVSGSNMCGNGPVSTPLQLLVNEIPFILIQPVSPPAIYAGSGSAQFMVYASGTGISYQWQEFFNSWTDLNENELYAGVNSDTLVIVNPEISMNGFRYRCLVSGDCEPDAVTDGNAVLNVLLPVGIPVDRNQFKTIAYPNPFSNQFNLNYTIPYKGDLLITAQDLLGETMEMIHEYNVSPGNYQINIKTAGLEPGLYTLVIKLNDDNNLVINTMKIVCIH